MHNERTDYEHIERIEPNAHEFEPLPISEHTDDVRSKMGAWRWLGLEPYRDLLMSLMHDARVMDFGGSAGPISNDAEIVDYEADAKAPYDLTGKFDVIFTSHTLEHIADVQNCVNCLVDKLNEGGWFVAFVPGWKYEPWRAVNYPTHYQTFYLSWDELPEDIRDDLDPSWTAIDQVLEDAGLTLHTSDWTHEECIILFATKLTD